MSRETCDTDIQSSNNVAMKTAERLNAAEPTSTYFLLYVGIWQCDVK